MEPLSFLSCSIVLSLAFCSQRGHAQSSGNGDPNVGLPCVVRFNQLYCHSQGSAYPQNEINSYIVDNLALMRRMYGNLIKDEQVPTSRRFLTPASTGLLHRTVRTLGKPLSSQRFARSTIDDDAFPEELADLEDLLDWPSTPEADILALVNSFNMTKAESNSILNHLKVHQHLSGSGEAVAGRAKRQAGFPGNPDKDDRVDVCDSRVEVTTPFWATNSKGKVRAIVNNKEFEQAVHQEFCGQGSSIRCGGDCGCEQKYKWHRLMAYDPNSGECGGIFMDWFLFPSCCVCKCKKNPFLDSLS